MRSPPRCHPDELTADFIIPSVFDNRVAHLVAEATAAAAVRDGVVRPPV